MTAKRIYFFSGTDYSRFDESLSGVPVFYPANIARWWPGLAAGPIDAALNWGANRVYFFVGANYYRWNPRENSLEAGYPKPITGNWAGFAGTGFENGFDDAVNWGNGKVYFFKGDMYLRMDWNSQTVDAGYPKAISAGWPDLTKTGFGTGIDAAVNRGNGKAYFFRGANYIRYDITSDVVDSGYPKAIAGNWGGVFAGGVSAAVEWPFARVDAGGLRAPVNQQAWRTDPVTATENRVSVHFELETDFINTTYPESCPVGEYRQFVRGTFLRDGVAIRHPLANPTGGPARDMRAIPAVGAADDNFQEDGLAVPGPGMNVWYGHRTDIVGNADATDNYRPDRDWGCQYRGNDTPSLRGVIGRPFRIDLDFRATAIDRTSDEVLQTIHWSVNTAGTF